MATLTGQQGYQIVGLGARHAALAVSCAQSIRLFDPARPIQLVTHADDPEPEAGLFDVVTRIDPPAFFNSPAIKLELDRLSPFAATMFVDADCLMLRDDIDRWWRTAQAWPFAIPGQAHPHGPWYGQDIAALCARFECGYLWKMNSGVIYFDRSPEAGRVFAEARLLVLRHGALFDAAHRGLTPDEPFLAGALGRLEMSGPPILDDSPDCWMLSTIRAEAFERQGLDFRYVKVSGLRRPTLVHFVGLEPANHYAALRADIERAYRERAGSAPA